MTTMDGAEAGAELPLDPLCDCALARGAVSKAAPRVRVPTRRTRHSEAVEDVINRLPVLFGFGFELLVEFRFLLAALTYQLAHAANIYRLLLFFLHGENGQLLFNHE